MRLLAKVESAFNIGGRGVVVIPVRLSDLKVKVGDTVQLRTPNGQVWDTRIAGIELVKRQGEDDRTSFLLTRGVTSDEIITGTEMWFSDVPTPAR